MKAVIYARYSSDNQREESIEGQIRECTAFAEKNGMTVLRHYIDRAYSAKTDNRPEFQRMIQDSREKLFDIVLVWKLDRFARNRYDSAQYKNILKKNGVRVVSANEAISDSSEGILMESILEGFAEYFSADLAEKVSRGMTENALKCKFNGGNPTVGYLIDSEQHFQIDPVKAPFVLNAFKMYDEGSTMSQIRDYLNEHNVCNNRGGKHTTNSVAKILKNRRYIGEYSYRDVVIPNGIPAIVPEDLFERVQEKIEKNKKAPARHKAEDDYLLTTKLFCGNCGAYMCGESGRGRNGIVHRYYKCVSVKKKRTDCRKKAVKKDWIENLVISQAMKLVNDEETVKAIAAMLLDMQERENTNLPLLTEQLREAQRGIDNLLNAIQQGIFTKSTKSRLEELEAAKEELEIKIANEKLAKPKLTEEQILFYLHKFRVLDMSKQSHRQRLIDTFINRIYLYDDKLVITFNHKDGAETITLGDIETALAEKENGSDLVSSAVPRIRTLSQPDRGSDFFHFFKKRLSFREREEAMKEELGKLTEQVVRNGQAVLSGIKSETDKLLEEAVNLMDERDRRKTWSGIDSIRLCAAPDTIVPGCIVLEGGSFRGCYSSGVLDVLMENGINLQTTIGTSAGALNGYNYVAGEIGRAARINLGFRHDRRYFGPRTLAKNRGVVGFDFLLNQVEEEIPFHRERFDDPARRLVVTVTNCETGQVIYCEKGVTPDFLKAVQASASMPFVSDMVEVDGVPCLDGGCAVKIPYQWALEQGFEKILVIRTRPVDYRRPAESKRFTEISELIYRNYPNLVERLNSQSEQYNHACQELEQLQEQGRLLMLCPSGSISVSTMEGDMERLGALYLLGRSDAKLMLPTIRRYLGLPEQL